MRFKWLKKGSEQAVITMSYVRCSCTKTTIEDAVKATLASGRHCINHERINDKTFARLCRSVKQLVEVQHARAK